MFTAALLLFSPPICLFEQTLFQEATIFVSIWLPCSGVRVFSLARRCSLKLKRATDPVLALAFTISKQAKVKEQALVCVQRLSMAIGVRFCSAS